MLSVERACMIVAINKINRIFEDRGIETPENKTESKKKKEFKEYLGHTPFEVLGGALLGILLAMLVPMSIG